jgi:cytochrome c5
VLYAVDAASLALLWRSTPGELQTSGKYNEPTVADGAVFVGTDRIQAFGLGAHNPRAVAAVAVAAAVSPGSPAAQRSVLPATSPGAATAALYQRRCAACHESGDAAIPSRAQIATRSRSWVMEKLMLGSMQAQALGLSEAEIGELASYLSREP